MIPIEHKYKPYLNRGRTMVHLLDGSRIQLSKVVMMNFLHTDKIPNVFHIHHINGDKADDRIENLQLMRGRDHLKLHHPNDYSRYGVSCNEDRKAYEKARSQTPERKKRHREDELVRYGRLKEDPEWWQKRQLAVHNNYLSRKAKKTGGNQ